MSLASAASIAGLGLGVLGAMKGPKTGTSTSTQTSTPYQQAQYQQLLDRAEALYGQQYGEEFTQALNQERANLQSGQGLSQQAIGMLQDMVGEGSALARTAEGAYLDPDSQEYKNLYELSTRNMRENFSDTILPALQSNAMSAGRWGSTAQQREMNKAGKILTNQLSDVNVRMAEQERQRQLAAINQRATLAGNLAGYQGNVTKRLGQIDPYTLEQGRLKNYQNFISGSMGNTGTSTEPTSRANKFMRLGSALVNTGDYLDRRDGGYTPETNYSLPNPFSVGIPGTGGY